MTYINTDFSPIGGQSTRGAAPQEFSYVSATDNKQVVQVDGYFNGARTYLEKDDIIIAIASNGYITLKITLVPLGGDIQVEEATAITGLEFIDSKESFPIASAGVITLEDDATYFITTTIDLLGDRLVAGQNTSFIGGSSESSRLKSTGLTGTALLSSAWTMPMRNIAIEANIAIDLDATANANQALDWTGVNFVDCATVGTVKNYDNFIHINSAFLDSGNLTFDGTIGTIAFETTLFSPASGQTTLILPSTLTVSRRFRVNYSAFVVLSGETGINVDASASIPNEGYILDTVNFAGPGTFLAGVASTDNKARFEGCRGINNSANIGQYFMTGNGTSTTIGTSGVYIKAAGTTSAGTFVEKFDVTTTDNKAVYEGSLSGFYKVTATSSLISGNNKVIALRIALNGTTAVSSRSASTTNSGGRAEGITCQDVVSLTTDDFIEIFVTNETDTTAVTIEDLNVIIERLN